MPDKKQTWRQLTDCERIDTYALELPHGCLILVENPDEHQALIFVPGVRISDAHGICLATPSREQHDHQDRRVPSLVDDI